MDNNLSNFSSQSKSDQAKILWPISILVQLYAIAQLPHFRSPTFQPAHFT